MGNQEVAVMTDRIEKTITLRAPVDRVWRALTTPAEFGQWFGVKLDGVFTVGQIARGPLTYAGYEHIIWEATIVAMHEPHLFAFTWHPYAMDPAVDYSGETPTRVEFRLQPAPEGAHLVIVESGFDAIPSGRRDEALRMNDRGWTAQTQNIRAHVES
jgi:uncharacterized protein YndB with AHSA1/START domain